MTTPTPKPRTARISTAEKVVAKIRAAHLTQSQRQQAARDTATRAADARFLEREQNRHSELINSLSADEQKVAFVMLGALGIKTVTIEPPKDETDDVPPVTSAEDAPAPESLPKGAREYTPGPVAQAAERARRP